MLSNRFGHFDPSGRTFTITDPATPAPWVNVICNGRYGLVVSQNGGGFSWFDDAQHNVLTRWEMDLVRDTAGKYLFLSDLESGETWSALPAPCFPNFTEYRCTHGPGYTTFVTAASGIRAEWTLTVAPDDAVELWHVTLTNTDQRTRRLRVSSYFDWCCGVAPDAKREFHRLFFTTKHDAGRRAILATKNMWDIPTPRERDHWNLPWPYVAAHAVAGVKFERDLALADKARFMGRYRPVTNPAAMVDAAPAIGGFGRFGDAAAALGGDLTLAPGQRVSFHYLIAIAADEKSVLSLVDRYSAVDPTRVIAGADAAWAVRLASTAVSTSRPDFDLLNNHWLAYQAISGRMWGRTGFYQQSGARGFRDQLQDSQVWLPIEPSRTLDQCLLHASRQFADGSVNHWWHALANFGNHTACSDDYLWLPFVLAAYIRETGDAQCLQRRVPFMDDPTPATLQEHCRRAIARAFERTSARGLPHIGSCDWNDGLSAMGVEEKGESAWLAMFLCQILSDWAIILDRLGDRELAETYRAKRVAYAGAVNEHAWDGRWYRYGTKDNGQWIGSDGCAEGKIHLNAQTWSILTEIAPPERATAAWASVCERLLSPYGPLLLAPAYTVPDPDIGYVTRYAPGTRENGGVYMHAATWALAAAAKQRDAGTVGKIWDSISPPHRGQNAEAYWAEPYVTPGNVDGPLSDLPGRAGWTWYTGSAAWLNRVCLEWMLGVRPTWEGLLIDPVPAPSLGKVRATRTWRGRTVTIEFDAAEFMPDARTVLRVDGQELSGNVLPPSLASERGELSVSVSWTAYGVGQRAPAAAGRARP